MHVLLGILLLELLQHKLLHVTLTISDSEKRDKQLRTTYILERTTIE